MRQANTTFVNLRAALDDLDPLIQPIWARSPPTCPVPAPDPCETADPAGPVFANLTQAIARPGKANDLTDSLRDAPRRSARRVDRWLHRSPRSTLPAEHRAAPGLLAGSAQPGRTARPGHRLLRRQRPLRARHSCGREPVLECGRDADADPHRRSSSTSTRRSGSDRSRAARAPRPRRTPAGRRRPTTRSSAAGCSTASATPTTCPRAMRRIAAMTARRRRRDRGSWPSVRPPAGTTTSTRSARSSTTPVSWWTARRSGSPGPTSAWSPT